MKHLMTLIVKRMHPHFFAEVSGVDLATSFDSDILTEVVNAFAEHSVLLFRNQVLNDQSQIAFSERM